MLETKSRNSIDSVRDSGLVPYTPYSPEYSSFVKSSELHDLCAINDCNYSVLLSSTHITSDLELCTGQIFGRCVLLRALFTDLPP
jgi:hypothetical protein